jgi:choline dehydrogenase
VRSDWDYIIIGGGSAGAVLAARLSEDIACRVLLVEAGERDWSPAIHIPGLLEGLLGSRTLNWQYRGEPDPSLGGRALTWAGGHVLGGSSSINGMVYGRGVPADYARWVAAGNPGWGWEDMLPWFRKLEDWSGPAHPARGGGGPVAVRRFEETDPACRAAMDALMTHGVPYVEDYAVGIDSGVGLTQATQRGGWRASTAAAYLAPARRRSNLTILTRASALRLTIEGNACTGAVIAHRGRVHHLTATRETIVAAGAIASPKLLLLSGIGDEDALTPHGIAVRHRLPGVGRNLNDHVNVRLSAHVDTPTYNSERRGIRALAHGLRFLAKGTGPASSPANHVQAFVRTDRANAAADVQIQLMAFGFGTPQEMRRDGITAVVSPCHPAVRGRVSLHSDDPATPPKIEIAMLGEESDRAALLRGCRLAETIIREGPGGRLYEPATRPESDADWQAFFRRNAGLNWHPTSTCRMGPDPATDVVDPALRVHGLQRLSIVDASVMPCVTSGNTNAPVIAIAERAAAMIAARTI